MRSRSVYTQLQGLSPNVIRSAKNIGEYNSYFNYIDTKDTSDPYIGYRSDDIYRNSVCYGFYLLCNMDITVSHCGSEMDETSLYLLDENGNDIRSTVGVAVEGAYYDVEEETYGTMEQGAKKLLARMEKLLEGADRGKIIREGLQTVIVGKPNVGKSSLLNWLLEEDRAIVTDIPGTTRDTVEEYLNIDGIPIKIVDTAGIRETGDVVEKMGVEKSKAYAETADLVIMMLDGSRPLEEEDKEILSFIRGKKTIVLLNKVDLAQRLSIEALEPYIPQEQILSISVKENKGFDALLDALKNMFLDGHTATAEDALLGNTRHKDALYRAKEAMEHCMETITMRMPEDFISMDLQDANRALGEITGDTSDEEIIDRIFTKFCLGK